MRLYSQGRARLAYRFDAIDDANIAADDARKVWDSELQFGANLLQGRGVSEHLEDLYFKGLQEVVLCIDSDDCWVRRGESFALPDEGDDAASA